MAGRSISRWSQLYAVAAAQEGYFTTQQAREAGFSNQLLHHHAPARIFQTPLRGIYRFVFFPQGEHEDLVVAWLWADQQSVMSHETALALHKLSDVLPHHIHMTLPTSWARRRLRVPANVVLAFRDIDDTDRTWVGAVPVTQPLATLRDCKHADVSPEFIHAGAADAVARGLLRDDEVAEFS
jgi:predicted transcriptional regulator of viral defense system